MADHRLIRIEHERCNEYDCVTYAWAPSDWDEDRIDEAISKAQKAYLEVAEGYKTADPPPNNATAYSHPNYKQYPDLTVREVDAIHEQAKLEYKAWSERKKQAEQPFMWYLASEGLLDFYSGVDEVLDDETFHAYWGHRHGTRLDYGQENPARKDLPGVGKLPEDDDDV